MTRLSGFKAILVVALASSLIASAVAVSFSFDWLDEKERQPICKHFGVAVTYSDMVDSSVLSLLQDSGFSSVTTENAFKMRSILRGPGQYDFSETDHIVGIATSQKLRIRAHTLLWHGSVPAWMETLPSEDVKRIVRDYFRIVFERYEGRIQDWDVVNEAFNDSGEVRDDFWKKKIGENYPALAFKWATEETPSGRLFYNDYSIENVYSSGKKVMSVSELIGEVRDIGGRIDGVGLQSHVNGDYPGARGQVRDTMSLLSGRGVQVEVSELDVVAKDEEAQSRRYEDFGAVCAGSPECTGLSVWGLSDKNSWRSSSAPLLFNADYERKKSFYSLSDALKKKC